jgi:hypothetical protein
MQVGINEGVVVVLLLPAPTYWSIPMTCTAKLDKLLSLFVVPSNEGITALRTVVFRALPKEALAVPMFLDSLKDSEAACPDMQFFLVFCMCAAFDSCSDAMEAWNGKTMLTKTTAFSAYVRRSFHRMIRGVAVVADLDAIKLDRDLPHQVTSAVEFSTLMRIAYVKLPDT